MFLSFGVLFWSHSDVRINHSSKTWRVNIVVDLKSFCTEKDHRFQAYLFGDHFLYSHDLTVWFRAITVIPVATLAEKNANCEDFQGANYLYVDNGPNRSVQSWLLLINGWNFVPHTIPYNVFKFSYNGSSRNLINTESRIMWRFHELIVLLFLETWASDAFCVTNMFFHWSDSQFWEVILINKITFYLKKTWVVITVTICYWILKLNALMTYH